MRASSERGRLGIMKTAHLTFLATLLALWPVTLFIHAEPELIRAFLFGSRL